MKIQEIISFGSPLIDKSREIEVIVNGKKYDPPFPLKNNDTFVGIEVEVERVFRSTGILALEGTYLWNNIEDGSLRNNGREFVSIPVKGVSIQFAINQLQGTLTKEKSCIGHEFTDRTSVHVHMNIRDLTLKQLMNLVLTYLVVEPLLYEFVGGDRYKNIFCVPLTQSSMVRDLAKMFQRLETNNPSSLLDMFSRWHKYTGLNLTPVTNYGTIEYRHMCGTCDEAGLSHWLNLILAIKNFAVATDYESNKSRILNMNTTSEYSMYVHEIFGNDAIQFSSNQLNTTMEQTSMFVKDVYSILENDTKSLFNDDVNQAIKESGDNLFFENSYKRGFLNKIDVDAKVKEYEALIASYKEEIEKRKLQQKQWESDLKNKEITGTGKTKIKSNMQSNLNYIDSYKHGIYDMENEIKALTSEDSPKPKKSSYGASFAEMARQAENPRPVFFDNEIATSSRPTHRDGARPVSTDTPTLRTTTTRNTWAVFDDLMRQPEPATPDNTDIEEDF